MTIRSMPSACTAQAAHSGAILTGVFASSAINPIFKDANGNPLPSGAVDGNWHQVLNQLVGIGLAWVISIVGTLVLLKAGRSHHWSARHRASRKWRVSISRSTAKKATISLRN